MKTWCQTHMEFGCECGKYMAEARIAALEPRTNAISPWVLDEQAAIEEIQTYQPCDACGELAGCQQATDPDGIVWTLCDDCNPELEGI